MTTQEGNNAVVARHLEALANAAKNYTIAELANVSVSNEHILPTVASSVNGGFWLDVSGDTPVPKFYYGGVSYPFGGIVTPSTPDYSQYLVGYLPFENSTTEDTCGNTWTATGNVSLEIAPVKFGAKSLHCPAGAYIRAQNVLNLYAEKWTFDCWANYQSIQAENAGAVALGTTSTQGYNRYGVIVWDKDIGIAGNGDSWQLDQATPNNFPSALNQWVHIAIVKNGTAITFFEDGQTVASHTLTETPRVGSYFWLGATPYGANTDVYLDNVRFFEGVALWTSNFTPPTANDYA